MTIDPRTAFENTDPAYLASCLAQRQPGEGGAGSRFLEPTTLDQLTGADWQPYEHPAVQAPATAFRAPIKGRLGIVALARLDSDLEVVLDDRKGTGKLEVVIKGQLGPEVEFTTLLVGPSREDSEKLVIWTFFPGDPIGPSQLEIGQYNHGDTITVAEAIELGLEYGKIE